jgi:hypothetical protein
MANDLTFNNEWTIKGFASSRGIQKIDIIKNPKNGNLFWSALSTSGKMSGPIFGDYTTVERVVECITPDGETLYALAQKHEESDNVLTTIAF